MFGIGGRQAAQAPADDSLVLDGFEQTLVEGTNLFRRSQNLAPLEPDTTLMATARAYAGLMAARRELGHDVGGSFDDRMAASGFRGRTGENVALRTEEASTDPALFARAFVEGWVNSPGHRANMLEADWNRIGVGSALGGDGLRYAVQVFGTAFQTVDVAEAERAIIAAVNVRRQEGGLAPLATPDGWRDMVRDLLATRGQANWPDDIFQQLSALGTPVYSIGGSGLTLERPYGASTGDLVRDCLESLLAAETDAVSVLGSETDFMGLAIQSEAEGTRFLMRVLLGASEARLASVKVSNGSDGWLRYEVDGAVFWSGPQLTRQHRVLPGVAVRFGGIADAEGAELVAKLDARREVSGDGGWLVSGPRTALTLEPFALEQINWGD